ncbi:MAG: bifunctional 3,4-dihydroxy-2-butanone-4-phosphate synthase/GTP cyclohydrolase II, partial [Candidatus Micrarchaeota archaeon]
MRLPSKMSNGRTEEFKLWFYRFGKDKYYVLEKGNVWMSKEPLVRIHSACSFAHVFDSQRCDCKSQFDLAKERISKSQAGLLIYAWSHEGRSVGFRDHFRAYMKQDQGHDTVSS